MAFQKKGVKAQKIDQVQAQQVLTAVKDVSLEGVVADLGKLQLTVQKQVADLSSELQLQVTQLSNVRAAITIEQGTLENLFEIKTTATTLDDLKAEIAATREAWQQEQEEREAEWAREDSERDQERARAEDKYNYDISITRRNALDAWQADFDAKKRAEDLRRKDLQRSWDEREAALKAAEKELEQLRAKVASFDESVKAAVAAEVKNAAAAIERRYNSEAALAKLEASRDISIKDAALKAADNTIAQQQKQIDDLKAEVRAANERASAIANQALQAASGQSALRALQEDRSTRTETSASPKNR
jgi:hypothetical protein